VDRLPFLSDDHTNLPPNWVCELVSDDTRTNPAIDAKLALYSASGSEHAWIVDIVARHLRVLARSGRDWKLIAAFDVNDEVRAPPFDAISFSLADLWPLDPPLGFNEDPTPYYAGDR
jgi:Uma2 family endonuclease